MTEDERSTAVVGSVPKISLDFRLIYERPEIIGELYSDSYSVLLILVLQSSRWNNSVLSLLIGRFCLDVVVCDCYDEIYHLYPTIIAGPKEFLSFF